MFHQRFGDGLAIFHAWFVAGAPAEPLESLPLLQQRVSQAICEVIGRCFYEVHAQWQHGAIEAASRYPLNPTR